MNFINNFFIFYSLFMTIVIIFGVFYHFSVVRELNTEIEHLRKCANDFLRRPSL